MVDDTVSNGTRRAGLNGSVTPYLYPPLDNSYLINVGYPGSWITLSDMTTIVNKVIDRKGNLVLLFHKLVPSGPVDEEWLISDFRALMDYIISKRVDVVTMSEWYRELSTPRKIA